MSFTVEFACRAHCHPLHIWRVFQQLELWPGWSPEALKEARWAEGHPWTLGSKIELVLAAPMNATFTADLIEVVSPKFVHFKAKRRELSVEHWYAFDPHPDGLTTEIRTTQQYAGPLFQGLGERARQPLLNGFTHLLLRCKAQAEEQCRLENWVPPCV